MAEQPAFIGLAGRRDESCIFHPIRTNGRYEDALRVSEAVFLTNVPGVLQDGRVLPALGAERARQLIESGVISGGMIPKVRSALAAVESGIAAVRITNLAGLAAGTGTSISQ